MRDNFDSVGHVAAGYCPKDGSCWKIKAAKNWEMRRLKKSGFFTDIAAQKSI